MHFPQVRRVRRGGNARFHMHIAVERRQRENLRVPVVLVHDPRRFICGRCRLQVSSACNVYIDDAQCQRRYRRAAFVKRFEAKHLIFRSN